MRELVQNFKKMDLGFLHIIAELWEIDISKINEDEIAPILANRIKTKISEINTINKFPVDVQSALTDLIHNRGAMPWSVFAHQHGTIREIGAARRDREKPYRFSISPAEFLWYRGILFRAFQDTTNGAEEFAYIPQDLLSAIPQSSETQDTLPGRPALQDECVIQILANDAILDQTCTLLAALRLEYDQKQLETIACEWLGICPTSPIQHQYNPTIPGLIQLLRSAELLTQEQMPILETTRVFLESSRGEALKHLYDTWKNSFTFNELRMVPSLIFEGKWQNDPLKARQAILSFLSQIPSKVWWNLSSLTTAIKQENPDFQRRAGEYDSWYIRSSASNTSLRGFNHWDDIEGALIRFIICGLLHWLGLVDLAAATESSSITAFRITPWGDSLLKDQLPAGFKEENQPIYIYADGRILVPNCAPRATRYQISRFCRWERKKTEEYQYRITPESLEQAARQNLRVDHIIALLQRHAASIPPSLTHALSRWEKYGCEARLEEVTVLRVRDTEIINQLKKSKVARFLGDSLGPASIIIKPGGWEKVQGFLFEQGYLSKS